MVFLTLDSLPQIPRALVGDHALSAYFTEGYLTSGGSSVGYYWNMDNLKKSVIEHHILPRQIVGLYYHSDTKKFEDISNKVRAQVFE